MDYKPYGTANTVLLGLQLDISNGLIMLYGHVGDTGHVTTRYLYYPLTINHAFFPCVMQLGDSNITVSGFLCAVETNRMFIKSSVSWISVQCFILGN